MNVYIGIIVFLFGASFGSFINVMVMRTERGQKFVHDRSKCLFCGHNLSYLDTVPLIGYMLIGGQCRYCGKHISMRYPLTELIGGTAALLTYMRYELKFEGLIVLAILMNLLVIALYDHDTMMIPDEYIISLAIFTVLHMITGDLSAFDREAGALIISLPMLLIIITVKGFGIGDLYISVLCGLCFGYRVILVGFLLGLLFCSGKAIYMIVKQKVRRGDTMPFAPYFCLGITVALFYWEKILYIYGSFMH